MAEKSLNELPRELRMLFTKGNDALQRENFDYAMDLFCQVLAKDLYTPVWDDVQAGPVSCVSIGGPPVPTVVSRKTHGGAGTFDIPLPLAPNPIGIECRTGQGANSNEHDVVVTFLSPITVGSVTSSCGAVSSTTVSGCDCREVSSSCKRRFSPSIGTI